MQDHILRQTDLDRIAKKRLQDDGIFDICEFALPGVHPAAQLEYDPVHWKWFQEAFDCPIIDINQVSYSLLFVTQLACKSLRPYSACMCNNNTYLMTMQHHYIKVVKLALPYLSLVFYVSETLYKPTES